ncbi:MAG: AAA family ATPase [Candidatus Helarchaeota archaeon]|nr:AAA family ATPase [Candidatus Helarchaeota archaeon]
MKKGYKSLITLMGLPSSGKSTIARMLAKELTDKSGILTVVIGTDDIRKIIPSQLEEFDPDIEPIIKKLTLNNVQFCLNNNFIVINDDMNYYKSMRHELKQIAEETQAHFILIHIQISLETALEWNKKRGLPVPQEVIKRVYHRFDPPGDYKWDTPLVTIQSDKRSPEFAIKTILSKLLPIITSPFKPQVTSPPSKPGINEQIDKITRKMVADFAQTNKNPPLLKKISNFRIDYIKNLPNKEILIDELEKDFSQKLQEFVTRVKQAK